MKNASLLWKQFDVAGEFSFRRLTRADLPFLLDVRNECRDCLHDNREFSLDQCREWFAVSAPEFWLILLNDTEIGYFRTSERADDNSSVMIGADLHNRWRGHGHGYLAWRRYLDKEFSDPALQTIRLEVLEQNVRASNLYNKLGFATDDRGSRIFYRGAERVRSLSMYLTREAWERGERLADGRAQLATKT